MITLKTFIEVATAPHRLKEVLMGCGSFVLTKFELEPTETKLNLLYRVEHHCIKCEVYDNGFCSNLKNGVVVETFDYYGEIREEGKQQAGCGCNIYCKASLENQKCPLGKW